MNDGAHLLAAILAAPDDDTPRLVYADWLEDHGDPARAEFIRVQCRIAALRSGCNCGECVRLRGGGQHHNGPCAVDQEREELPDGRSRKVFLRQRERELWELHGRSRWGFDCPGRHVVPTPVEGDDFGLGNGDIEGVFRRGFVESLSCDWADFDRSADAILAAAPVREVRLTTMPNRNPAGFEQMPGSREHPADFHPVFMVAGRRVVVGPGEAATLPAILSARWPQVKTWNLPQSPGIGPAAAPYFGNRYVQVSPAPLTATQEETIQSTMAGRETAEHFRRRAERHFGVRRPPPPAASPPG